MAAELKNRIQEEMKQAMRDREKERLGLLRLLLSAIKQREIDHQVELDDKEIAKIIEKMIKQRRDSIGFYEAGNRNDLAEKEQKEIEFLQAYLPEALSESEVDTLINEAIEQTKANSMKDMGKVMTLLKEKLEGQRADMNSLSEKVKQRLA